MAKKVQLSLTLQEVHNMSLRYEHRTLPLQAPKEERKRAVFRVKLHFTLRKSATKFLYVNIAYCQRQSCKALAWPIYPCKNISRVTSSTPLRENVAKTTNLLQKLQFPINFGLMMRAHHITNIKHRTLNLA